MANRMLWRYGDTYPVVAFVRNVHTIEIGDLVYGERDAAGLYTLPASEVNDQGTIAINQKWFKCKFLGVAMQQHRPSHDPLDVTSIRVATKGTFEFDCASALFDIADRVGVAENAAGNALLNQTVIEVPLGDAEIDQRSIGIVQKQVNVAATTVYVRITSELMEAGYEGDTCSGSSSSGE